MSVKTFLKISISVSKKLLSVGLFYFRVPLHYIQVYGSRANLPSTLIFIMWRKQLQ